MLLVLSLMCVFFCLTIPIELIKFIIKLFCMKSRFNCHFVVVWPFFGFNHYLFLVLFTFFCFFSFSNCVIHNFNFIVQKKKIANKFASSKREHENAHLKEYTEEFRDIAKGNKSKEALPAAPITLIHQRPVGEELPVCMPFCFL